VVLVIIGSSFHCLILCFGVFIKSLRVRALRVINCMQAYFLLLLCTTFGCKGVPRVYKYNSQVETVERLLKEIKDYV